MPKTCFVPYCPSGLRCARRKGMRFFTPPKDEVEFQKWRNLIRRKDRQLTTRSYICEEHFDESSLVKYFEHIINGELVRIPRRWTLKRGALPTIIPQFPDYKPRRKLPEILPPVPVNKNSKRKTDKKPSKVSKVAKTSLLRERLVQPKAKRQKSKKQKSKDAKPATNTERSKPSNAPEAAKIGECSSPSSPLSGPRPSTTIYIKTEPLSDYEDCDNSNKRPRMDANPSDLKTEDLLAVEIKEEFDPDALVIKAEVQSETEDEGVIDYQENIVNYELRSRTKSVINYENGDTEIRNEIVSSSVSVSEFSGFSFVTCERPEPYVVNAPTRIKTATKRVQTDITSAFQHDQLITYHQLTEDKLMVFTGVTKHKFMILYNFLFCNSAPLVLKCLSDEDQLLLVLLRFKHNPPKEYLSHLFGITEKQVSHIMSYITTKFRKGLNDVTMWSLKEGKCSLGAIMECRDFISTNLKSFCPHQEIAPFF